MDFFGTGKYKLKGLTPPRFNVDRGSVLKAYSGKMQNILGL